VSNDYPSESVVDPSNVTDHLPSDFVALGKNNKTSQAERKLLTGTSKVIRQIPSKGTGVVYHIVRK
jgi:hypothetical protein